MQIDNEKNLIDNREDGIIETTETYKGKTKKNIQELIVKLNEASKAYYKDDIEILSNIEYDKLYDELVKLEKQTGIVLANSPTQNVGYEVLEKLEKETHPKPMLSLDKTKSVDELATWLKDKEGLLSWKLDGLTVVLTYQDGELVKAVTRGNGTVGEVVTNNAKVFENLPLEINFKGELVLRGEAYITYSDFEKINRELPDIEAKYKNPRNLCSGSVRQLSNEITAHRHVQFRAFSLSRAVDKDDVEINFQNSVENQMLWLEEEGFEIVEFVKVDATNVAEKVETFEKNIADMDIPSDGLVLIYDDIEYGDSLGVTAKFPRNAIAFKWQDEIMETTLKNIIWSPSRTGLINPIAEFEPVELEGTTVTRASLHNVSIIEDLQLGIGDTVTVYKANMIIPQIAENLTKSDNIKLPKECPICGGNVSIQQKLGTKTLVCMNDECPAKKIKAFSLFVSRDALNIENLSEMTLEKFVGEGFIKEFVDIFKLDRYKSDIVDMDGFGEKSYANIVEATNKAKLTTTARLLYALGVPGIGSANARIISKACNDDWEKICNLTFEELLEIDNIGEVLADGFVRYFANDDRKKEINNLIEILEFEQTKATAIQDLHDLTFVITGSIEHFKNRNELKVLIQERGGKVAGSVSKNTNYLINNDINSNSSKNKKAKELGVQIISEEDFLKMW